METTSIMQPQCAHMCHIFSYDRKCFYLQCVHFMARGQKISAYQPQNPRLCPRHRSVGSHHDSPVRAAGTQCIVFTSRRSPIVRCVRALLVAASLFLTGNINLDDLFCLCVN